MKKILLDAGHGIDTPGKRSPIWSNGLQLFEWKFNRDIVRRIKLAIPEAIILVHEDIDVSLKERCNRANQYSDAILISIHGNAGGGTGFEAFTSIGKTKADDYATIIYDEVEKSKVWSKIRTDYTDGDPDKEESFYILKYTKCPAILTENGFMDTEADCKIMLSEEGRQQIARYHINAINRLLKL